MEKMHYDGASTYGGGKMSMQLFPTTPSPSLSGSSRIVDFTDPPSYSSIFFSPSNANHSHSATRTNTATAAISTSATASAPAGGDRYDHSLLMLEHQDLLSRHKSCLSQLQKTFQEAETLRQENTNLRVANCDLNGRLKRLVEAYLQNQYTSMMMTPGPSSLSPEYVNAPLSSITEKFGGMRVGEKIRESAARWEGCESPKSVIESDRAERDVDRGSLPKSISVRSSGFLKAAGQVTSTANNTNTSRGANRSRSAVPVDGPQKVYVRGGNQKDGPIELEVFNQGMIKTELCNKWQETGSCPYGEHCQFAHGFEQLRPVLRHPRYKTEVCRMVLAGDPCPYGHRCHFRHALTDQEKLMLPLKLD